MLHLLTRFIAVAAAVVAVGCAQEKKGKSGSVSVVFAKKDTATTLQEASLLDATEGHVLGEDLSTLKIKPIAVGVSAELNSNSYMIWGSKNCPGVEHEAKIDGKKYKYAVYQGEKSCAANADDDYLDMLDSAALNETLNSQGYPVPPGTYKYVKLVFCSDSKQDGVNNLMYRAPDMPEDHEVAFCDPFIGYSETGVTVSEGGSVKVKLTYDLDSLIDSLKHSPDMDAWEPGPADHGCYWTPDGMTQYCPKFGQDALVPSLAE